MTEKTNASATVIDLLEATGATLKDASNVAKGMGCTVDTLWNMPFNSMDADQLRTVATVMRRSSDELLAIASEPAAELDRRKARHSAVTDLEDSATIAVSRMRGTAHLLKQWCYVDGSDGESGAALDLLADVLQVAADDLEHSCDVLEALKGNSR